MRKRTGRTEDSRSSRPRFLGITRMCVGAWGLTSRNARHRSSSCTMVDGISFATILSKMVVAAADADCALLTSSAIEAAQVVVEKNSARW